jgi:hypothetical protein
MVFLTFTNLIINFIVDSIIPVIIRLITKVIARCKRVQIEANTTYMGPQYDLVGS